MSTKNPFELSPAERKIGGLAKNFAKRKYVKLSVVLQQ
jgi:hypothetical protein